MTQTMGFSPFFLMFGRIPKIPIDIEFGVTLLDLSDTGWQNYAQKLKAWLKWDYKKANELNLKEADGHKKYYNCEFKCMKLIPGDTVLVRIKAEKLKIIDRWEKKPYIVLEQILNQWDFKVKPIDDDDESNMRTLHHNMLFPIQSAQEESEQVDVTTVQTI